MYDNIRPFVRSFTNTCTFMDLESSGLDVENDRIIQFVSKTFNLESQEGIFPSNNSSANTLFSDKRVSLLSYIINPDMHVPKELRALTGITKEQLVKGVHLKDIASDIHTTFSNTEFVITYNGNKFDLPLLQNELSRVYRPMNYKTSKHFNNDCVMFIDVLQIVQAELSGVVLDWCRENNRPVDLKLNTVFAFITESFYDSLGEDVPTKADNFHNAEFDVNCTIRIFIGLIEKYRINVLNYVTSYLNINDYTLNLKKDSKVIITKRGNYADMTLEELLSNDNDLRSKKWLLKQHTYSNIKLCDELIESLEKDIIK